jgi:hypothetical protein
MPPGREEKPMSNGIEDLLAREAEAAEAAEASSDPNAPLPAHVKVTRGTARSRNLQVRFRDDEFDELAAYAEQRGLPVSTVVRMLVLQAIAPADDLKAALDRLEADVAAVRRKALSA